MSPSFETALSHVTEAATPGFIKVLCSSRESESFTGFPVKYEAREAWMTSVAFRHIPFASCPDVFVPFMTIRSSAILSDAERALLR